MIDWEQALAEALRVLRPGGVLIGYDLLDNLANHLIHVVDGARNRLMSLPELEAVLADLGAVATLRPLPARLGVRFRVRQRRA